MSVWQTPQASRRTSTSPARGSARSTSVTFSGWANCSSTAARIFTCGSSLTSEPAQSRGRESSASISNSSIRGHCPGSTCLAARVAANSSRRSSVVASLRRRPSARAPASSRSSAAVARSVARLDLGMVGHARARLAEEVVGGLPLAPASRASPSAPTSGHPSCAPRPRPPPRRSAPCAGRPAPPAARAWTGIAGRRWPRRPAAAATSLIGRRARRAANTSPAALQQPLALGLGRRASPTGISIGDVGAG